MSRIGKSPITIPQGVEVKVDNNTVTVKGPKGTLTETFLKNVNIAVEDNEVKVSVDDANLHGNIHGLTRTLINNMIIGVTHGFEKTLEVSGVGYRAQKQGNKVVLTIGFSHPVEIEEIEGITLEVPDQNTIVVKGIDKQLVGQVAANIREKKQTEPYKGKGIKYAGERVRRKEGKAGAKK